MNADLPRLSSLLGGIELAPLRTRLRARLRRAAPAEAFTLPDLTAVERRALEGLLGRRLADAASMRVTGEALDQALARAGLAADLRAALEALDGPLETHTERALRSQAWSALAAATQEPRLRRLLHTASGLGLLKRLARDPVKAAAMIADAARVLAQLPASGMTLQELATSALGDAHALDPGRRLAALVLRAAEGAQDRGSAAHLDEPGAVRGDEDTRVRNRWARLRVAVNELASPVLCLNLEADTHSDTDTLPGRLLREAREAGEPLHLSLRMLLRHAPAWRHRARTVYVCENPAIVSIAAMRLAARSAPLVCTDGMPAAAQRCLLEQLAASGAELRYHGDFDWPGLVIGNFVMRRFGARPWRFGATDYRGRSGKPLAAGRVEASWDAHLADAMSAQGYELHEEAVVETMLVDLACVAPLGIFSL